MEVQATSRGTGAVMHRNPAPSLPAGEVVTCRFPWVNKYFVIKAESKHLTDGQMNFKSNTVLKICNMFHRKVKEKKEVNKKYVHKDIGMCTGYIGGM